MTKKEFKEYVQLSELAFSYKGEDYCAECYGDNYRFLYKEKGEEQEIMFSSLDDMLDVKLNNGKPLKEILADIDW